MNCNTKENYHIRKKERRSKRIKQSKQIQKKRMKSAKNREYPYGRGYYLDDGILRRMWLNKSWLKRRAAKAVRKTPELSNGTHYKKAYDLEWSLW